MKTSPKRNWAYFFDQLGQDSENYKLIWNQSTRAELLEKVLDEISDFEIDVWFFSIVVFHSFTNRCVEFGYFKTSALGLQRLFSVLFLLRWGKSSGWTLY